MGLLDAVDRIHNALDYHLQRHNLLTANLAHIDTPGFRPLDLARGDALGQSPSVTLKATNAAHLGAATGGATFKVIEDRESPVGYDGNAVSVDREAVKIAANNTRYDVLAQLASSQLAGLAWAANDGRTG